MTLSCLAARLATASVAGALFLLPGCLKAHDELTFAKDGSGTTTKKMTIDMGKMKEIMDMFKGMAGGGMEAGGAEATNPMEKEFDDKMNPDEIK